MYSQTQFVAALSPLTAGSVRGGNADFTVDLPARAARGGCSDALAARQGRGQAGDRAISGRVPATDGRETARYPGQQTAARPMPDTASCPSETIIVTTALTPAVSVRTLFDDY